MIPKFVPPLTATTVLVTRPAAQAASLCAQIEASGGTALAFATLDIERLPVTETFEADLIVFVSVNAVAHGAHLVRKHANTRIAAIGRATAAALAQAQLPPDIVPATGFSSETLLAQPGLELAAGASVLIMRGEGGRELLQETFAARGMKVATCEVYRRIQPAVDTAARAALEARWADEGIDIVTATSVETLHNLLRMLSERGRNLLASTTLLVPSRRIATAAEEAGLRGAAIIAPGADDASMVGALARWSARARLS